VTVHGIEYFKNKELLETIKNIFSGNMAICKGCKLCKPRNAIKNEN
jgi:hypothetical protein